MTDGTAGRVCPREGCGVSLAGRRPTARYCSSACAKAYKRSQDPLPFREQERRSKARHADAVRARKAAYYAENAERHNERTSRRYYRCRDEELAKQRAYYESNGAAIRERVRQYRAANRDRCNSWSQAYRARKTTATVERFKPSEIYERDGWVCGICGEAIDATAKRPDPMSKSVDHIIPLARGGEHSRANCQAAHLVCNQRKHASLR